MANAKYNPQHAGRADFDKLFTDHQMTDAQISRSFAELNASFANRVGPIENEVHTARGGYDHLDDRLDAMSQEGGATDYTELDNKPQINSVELIGNKSLADLGIASAADVSAKQDALTFDTQTVRESAYSLTSGAIWASVWAQIFGLNTFTNLAAGDDLNDITTPGIYRCTGSAIAAQLVNMPSSIAQQAGGRLIVFNVGGSGRYIQLYISAGARFWLRSNTSAGWQPWYEYAGAEVTPAAGTTGNASAQEVI